MPIPMTGPVRPDPDALLAAAGREGRGKLKIFLGASPGVGKTYAMLSGAQRLRLAHLDVVVGIVETHGRVETEALLDGLDILPRRLVPYRGAELSEFDLDAALARRPTLLLVDELAHTNAPDSRHPKRYLDIEELLSAGIDVWTAVNIQHLESLSDVVSRITGIVVRETVPDTILDEADEVVVVDITPAELITRLSEGRIYLAENAARAANAFFKPGNLTALRELALRRTADRVDDQMIDHLRRNAVEGAWPTAERLMVCVGGDPSSETVVRAGSRLASGLNAPWVAVTLEHSGAEVTDVSTLRRIDDTMRLAERLGAETARLAGRDLPDEILRFARQENITQIVIGRSGAGFWGQLRGRSLSSVLLQRASDVAIHVVVAREARRRAWRSRWPNRDSVSLGLVAAIGSVAAAVLAAEAARQILPLPNLSMIFLAAVLGCAVTVGQWPAIAAAFLSFLAYNFFFIPPVYTLTIASPHELLALVVFLLVAVITGGLAGRVRDQSNAARNRVTTIQALYDVSRKLSGAVSLDDVLWIVVRQAAAAIKGQVLILLDTAVETASGDLALRAAFPPEDEMGASEWAAARWAHENDEAAGWRTGTLPNAQFQFRPIHTSGGIAGVIGYSPSDRDAPLPTEAERALSALIDQGALAIERANLVTEARHNEALAERERLQTTLLSSLSHDLRTPLASILGAVTSLRGYGDRMSAADRGDLLAAIEEETRRLATFVSNLLDITRVESGSLDLRRDWVDVSDVVHAAVQRAEKSFPNRVHEVLVAAGLPLVRGDPVMAEQTIFNLLDNANKYTPPGPATTVRVTAEDNDVTILIQDDGCGIPATDLDRVFEKFARVNEGDGRPAGTGLGLAVAKGVIDAMGGQIRAESPLRAGLGTRIVIHLPGAKPVPGSVHPEEEVKDHAGVEHRSRGRRRAADPALPQADPDG